MFFWIEILKTKKHEHKTSFFIFQMALYNSIFCQNSDFGAMVRYRLSSNMILNFEFNFSHDEFKNCLGSSLMIVIFPFLQLGQHKRS